MPEKDLYPEHRKNFKNATIRRRPRRYLIGRTTGEHSVKRRAACWPERGPRNRHLPPERTQMAQPLRKTLGGL